MMIATHRGIRSVPFLRSLIQRTTGAKMYAIKNAKMNGSSTLRPTNAIKTMNSGKPHRARNFRDGAFSPNHVSRRVRDEMPGNGPLSLRGIPSDGGCPGGSSGVIPEPVYQRIQQVLHRAARGSS